MPLHEDGVRDEIVRLERLLGELEERGDPAAIAAVQSLSTLYGAALERIMTHPAGQELRLELARDPIVGHLLLLHGLHPESAEERVRRALDEVRPYFHSHGGDVELLRIEQGTVLLRMRGSCEGCPSSALTRRHVLEEAIGRLAPEIERVEAVEAGDPSPSHASLAGGSR